MEEAADVPAPKPAAAEPILPREKDGGKAANGDGEGAQKKKGSPPVVDYAELEEILPVNAGRLKLYEVGKQIGTGKFSVVYRARMADGRHVALKKIHIFDMMDAKSRTKCLREVLMLQTISKHENLIAYLDAFIEDNELMIVFEWAESGDLRRLLRKTTTPFEERQVCNYFLTLLHVPFLSTLLLRQH